MRSVRTLTARCAAALVGITLIVGTGTRATAQTPPSPGDSGLLALPNDQPVRGMGWPALSPDGKTLCFTFLGDLWTVPVTGGIASRLTVHEALDANPRWSPDGKWIAFTSTRTGNQDIFLVPAQGGAARQVTFYSGPDIVSDWSPDGTKLLFSSNRNTRNLALFEIDLRDRSVRRLTNDDQDLRYAVWSPDGKALAYSRAGQPWWRPWYRGSVAAHIVTQDPTGKVQTLLKSPAQQFWPLWAADGKSLYVTTIYGKDSNTPNLWRVPLDGGEPRPITRYVRDAVRFPTLARNGSLLAYLYDGDLYTAKPDGSDAKKVSIVARSDDKINNQERVTLTQFATESELSPDGKQLALVIRGDIWLIPVSGGDAKRLTEDPASDGDISWSPDGKKLVFISDRGNRTDVYTLDVQTKALTRLTDDTDIESNPIWSPDGKWISFAKAGAKAGLYVTPSGGGAARRLAEGNGNNNFGNGIVSHTWSPDSRWVAFSRMDRYSNRDIWVVSAIGGIAINITRYPGANVGPQFTKDGRRLLFISDRSGPAMLFQLPLEQEDDSDDKSKNRDSEDEDDKKKALPDRSKDVRIDFDDIQLRAKAITLPIGNVDDFAPTPSSQEVIVHLANNFWALPITGGGMAPITTGGEPGVGIRFAPDGARFFYLGVNGTPRVISIGGARASVSGAIGLVGANPTGPPPRAPGNAAVSVIPFTAEMLFDRRETYRQAFNEFYRRFGAAFYDPKMNGVDWTALRARYEPLLQGVATPEEFALLLSQMVGVVNSSHSEITPAIRPFGPQTALLGLFYDESHPGPGLKVASVLRKGPADKPSTRILPGEYVLSVNGTDVKLNEEYYRTLENKAGKTVELLINSKPTKEGARAVKVRPISMSDWANLDYEARVRRSRELVNKLSDNRLAYIHIREMDETAGERFERELWSEALSRDGLILDIRDNGGGSPAVNDAILDMLSRKIYGYTQPRDGLRQSVPEPVWNKPVILLIDENSYSAAELFPAGFRALGLGKIVGVPTPGYVIGTYEGQLVDGTRFRLPSWAYYTPEGRNLENRGVAPDILVENRPEDIAAGHDRQLEVGVATALKQLPPASDTTASSK
jgi:Tol biopolymer transport system component/C-terminal processing protease CtpA/Prc